MTTGLPAGSTVVEEPWASAFLNGLVPARVDVSDECPNGIASATREISFLNGVVGTLTLSLYTPQSVTVTCAAAPETSRARLVPRRADATLASNATEAEVRRTLLRHLNVAASGPRAARTVHLHIAQP